MFGQLLDIILSRINKLLEDWVEPVYSKQLDLSSILAGRVDIRHIQIKQKVLDFFPIPVNLIFNYIGQIEVNISLTALFTRPITVTVDTIILVMSTRPSSQWDPNDFKNQFLFLKENGLAAKETATLLSSLENGVVWKIAMKLGKNFCVDVKNIHIRFEDRLCRRNRPLAIGTCIKSIHLEGANWTDLSDPPVVSDKLNLLLKKIKIDGFGVYVEDLNRTVPRGSDLNQPFYLYETLDHESSSENIPTQANGQNVAYNEMKDSVTDLSKQSTLSKDEDVSKEQSWFSRFFWRRKQEDTADPTNASDNDNINSTSELLNSGLWSTNDAHDERINSHKQVFSLDGRVPWRRLLAPFCRRRLYNIDTGRWCDDMTDADYGFPLNASCGGFCSEVNQEIDLDQLNLYADTDDAGFMKHSIKEPEDNDNIQENDDDNNFSSLNNTTIGNELFEEVLLPTAPNGTRSSLRVKLHMLPSLYKLLNKLNDAYHLYIIEPRQLELFITISALPVTPEKHHRRCWSQWGSSQSHYEDLSQTLPQCRLDIMISGFKLNITDTQTLHLLKWAEYSGILYDKWRLGLQSELELPYAPDDESQRYIRQWPIKLLQGDKAPKDIYDWCISFEKKYNSQFIGILRNKALNSLQETLHTDQRLSSDKTASTGPSGGSEDISTSSLRSGPISTPDDHSNELETIATFQESLNTLSTKTEADTQSPSLFYPLNIVTCGMHHGCRGPDDTGSEINLHSSTSFMDLTATGIREYMQQNGDIQKQLGRLRPIRFSSEVEIDMILIDTTISYCISKKDPETYHTSERERSILILLSCLHFYMCMQAISQQELSLNVELYPITIVHKLQTLNQQTDILPTLSPILFTTFQKEHTSFIRSQTQQHQRPARRRLFWSKTGDTIDLYKKTINLLKDIEPSFYLKMDLQLYRTIVKPDISLIFRSTVDIFMICVPYQLLQLFKDTITTLDHATHSDLADSVVAATLATVETGTAFSKALMERDVTHKNAYVDIHMLKGLHVILPKAIDTLDCEGYEFHFTELIMTSILKPQRFDYPLTLPIDAILDTYSIRISNVQLRRIGNFHHLVKSYAVYAGGVEFRGIWDLIYRARARKKHHSDRYKKMDSCTRNGSDVALGNEFKKGFSFDTHPFSLTHFNEQDDLGHLTDKKEIRRNKPKDDIIDHKLFCSYVVYPLVQVELQLKISHVPQRQDVPSLHMDWIQEEIRIDINDYDIECIWDIMVQCLELYYTFIDDVEFFIYHLHQANAIRLKKDVLKDSRSCFSGVSIQSDSDDLSLVSSIPGDILEIVPNISPPGTHILDNQDVTVQDHQLLQTQDNLKIDNSYRSPAKHPANKKIVRLADAVDCAVDQANTLHQLQPKQSLDRHIVDNTRPKVSKRKLSHDVTTEHSLSNDSMNKQDANSNIKSKNDIDTLVHIHAGIKRIHIRVSRRDLLPQNTVETGFDEEGITGYQYPLRHSNVPSPTTQFPNNVLLDPAKLFVDKIGGGSGMLKRDMRKQKGIVIDDTDHSHSVLSKPIHPKYTNHSIKETQLTCFGFHPIQTTSPLLSISIISVGAIIHTIPNKMIELRAGIEKINIVEETNISPICFSILYSNETSFSKPTRVTGTTKPVSNSINDLNIMFGSLNIRSQLHHVVCPVSAMALNTGHVGLYYYGDLFTKEQNILATLSSFRIVALWEYFDEIFCWWLSIKDYLKPLPIRETDSSIPPSPIPLREFLNLQLHHSSFMKKDSFNSSFVSRRKFSKTSDFSFKMSRSFSETSTQRHNSFCQHYKDSFIQQPTVPPSANLGYLLKPGIKIGVIISPFEILLPCEPLRMPSKERLMSEKNLRGNQTSSKSGGGGGSSSSSGKFIGTAKTFKTQQEMGHIDYWKNLYQTIRGLHSDYEDTNISLPSCVVIKAAIELRTTIFFYVPDKTLLSENYDDIIPLMISQNERKHSTISLTHEMTSFPNQLVSPTDQSQETNVLLNKQDTSYPEIHIERSSFISDNTQPPNENKSIVINKSTQMLNYSQPHIVSSTSQTSSTGSDSFDDLSGQELEGGDRPIDETDYRWLIGEGDGLFEEVELYMTDHPNYLLAMLCPCTIKLGINITECLISTAIPQTQSVLRFPKIEWRRILSSNLSLLSPMRIEIDADIFLSSASCIYERLHGITAEVANILRRSRGFCSSKYPEGVELFINIEPIVLNIDSESCLSLYQLISIINGLTDYSKDKLIDSNHLISDSNQLQSHIGLTFNNTDPPDIVEYGKQEDFLLNLLQTVSVEIGIKVEMIRINFWDFFNAQRRCCLSTDIENMILSLDLTPAQCTFPLIEDFWWNAFNGPMAVFYSSYLSKLIDEPFDFSSLQNPYARHRRKAKSCITRLSASTKKSVKKKYGDVCYYFHEAHNNHDDENLSLHDNINDPHHSNKQGLQDNEQQTQYNKKSNKHHKQKESSGQYRRDNDLPHKNEHYGITQWLSIRGSFLLSAEYLNRADKANYSVLEPFLVSLNATKRHPEEHGTIDINGSWINLNVNVAMVDALLVYGFSLIGSGIKQRSRLFLDIFTKFLKTKKRILGIDDNVSVSIPGLSKRSNTITDSRHTLFRLDPDFHSQTSEADESLLTDISGKTSMPTTISAAVQVLRIGKFTFFLRPQNRFDILLCLAQAMDLSIIGDAILAKSTSFLNPAAGFAGDALQSQQLSKTPTKRFNKVNVVGAVLEAKEKAVLDARNLPHIYNLLGQPLAVYTKLRGRRQQTINGAISDLERNNQTSWQFVEHQCGLSLQIDESGKTIPFILRLSLLNYMFDIPSSAFKLDSEGLDVITLSFDYSIANDSKAKLLLQTGRQAREKFVLMKDGIKDVAQLPASPQFLKEFPFHSQQNDTQSPPITNNLNIEQQGRIDTEGSNHKNESPHSRTENHSTESHDVDDPNSPVSHESDLVNHEISKGYDRRSWCCNETPRHRSSVKILVRTTQRLTLGDKLCFDIFLTSVMVIRNNTSLGLSVFPTVPGNFENERKTTIKATYYCRPIQPDISIPIEPSKISMFSRTHKTRRNETARSIIIYPRKILTASELIERHHNIDTLQQQYMRIADGGAGVILNIPGVHPHIDNTHDPKSSASGFLSKDISLMNREKSSLIKESSHLEQYIMQQQQQQSNDHLIDVHYGSTVGDQVIDVLQLEPFEQRVRAVPLFWLAIDNAHFWVASNEEKLFTINDTRDITKYPRRSDMLLRLDVLKECSRLDMYSKRSQDLSSIFLPRIIQFYNNKGTRIAISSSLTLVSSKQSGSLGRFCEVHLDHCFEICNRLPRPVHIRRIGGFWKSSTKTSEMSETQSTENVLDLEQDKQSWNRGDVSFREESDDQQYNLLEPNGKRHNTTLTAEPLSAESGLDLVDTELFTLSPGQDVTLPINPDAIVLTIDHFQSKQLPVGFHRIDTYVSQVVLGRIPKHSDSTSGQKYFDGPHYNRSFDESSDKEPDMVQVDLQESVYQTGLDALRLSLEYSCLLNSKRHPTSSETIRRTMQSLVRSTTIFAEAWIVNRLEYPIKLNRFDYHGALFVAPNSRAVVPADFVHNKMTLSIEAKQFERIPCIERYPARSQGWFFGTAPTSAISDEFLVSDLATKRIFVKRTAAHPHLSYSTYMCSAPAPFLRTTLVEVLPTFVIYNERNITLWFREDVLVAKSAFSQEKTNMVAYIQVLPKTAIEFHPQLSRTNVRIQISGNPKVETYFDKVIKPLLKNYYSSYSFQSINFNRDGTLWSPSFEISHPRVLQIRHPSIPTTPGQTCDFSLTEIEVTVRNGTSFVRLMDPNVPEYRIINLTSYCIAIGQLDHDFFEVLRPVSETHRRVINGLVQKRKPGAITTPTDDLTDKETVGRQAQDLLDFLSLPFSWYNSKVTRKLSIWAVIETTRQLWQRPTSSEVIGQRSLDGSDLLSERPRDFAFNVVTQARKEAAEVYRHSTENVIEGGIKGSERSQGITTSTDAPVTGTTGGITLTVDQEQIRVWGKARDYPDFIKTVDIEAMFQALKQSRYTHRPLSVIPLVLKLWSINNLDNITDDTLYENLPLTSTVLPILVRLRVIAGSKVIFIENDQGTGYSYLEKSTATQHIKNDVHNKTNQWTKRGPNLPLNPAIQRRRPKKVKKAIETKIRRTVVDLWIRGQHDSNALTELAVIVKHNESAFDHLADLWAVGSLDTRNTLADMLLKLGVEIDFEDKLNENQINQINQNLNSQEKQSPLKSFASTGKSSMIITINPTVKQTHQLITQGLADQAGPMDLSTVAIKPSGFHSNFTCSLCIQGLGVSLIDQTPAEFFYLSLARIILSCTLKSEEMLFRGTIGWIQIDNPSEDAYYPTVLRPIIGSVPGATRSATVDAPPIVDIELQQKLSANISAPIGRTLLEIPKVGLFLKPLSINVDFQMLTSLLKFVDDVLTIMDIEVLNHSIREIQISETDTDSPEWRHLLGPAICILDTGSQVDKVFISSFVIGRLAFIVNIRCGDQGNLNKSVEDQPKTEIIRAILSALNVRASISDAHLVLAQREQKDICGPIDRLAEEIILSYVGLAVGQLHKVLGAIDLLGNPAMVVKHVSSGVENGLIEIRRGIATGRADTTALSCGRAGCSVVCGCAAGFFDFATRCFGSWYGITDMIARNTDKYSLNPDLIKQGGLLDQPSNCCEGTWVGCHSCFLNFGLSFANIFYKPLKGTQIGISEGAAYPKRSAKCRACCKGCLLGGVSGLASICGLPSSLLLWGQFTTSGVLNQISAIPMLLSVRPRRVFTDGTMKLKSYSAGHALCGQLLRALPEASTANVQLIINLDPDRPRISTCEAFKQKLRISGYSNEPQDFLGLGSRRLGYFHLKKLLWHVSHTDITALEVIMLGGQQTTRASQPSTQRTIKPGEKGINTSIRNTRRPHHHMLSNHSPTNRDSLTFKISLQRTGVSSTLTPKSPRKKPQQKLIIASKKNKRHARTAQEKSRNRSTIKATYYLKFIIEDKTNILLGKSPTVMNDMLLNELSPNGPKNKKSFAEKKLTFRDSLKTPLSSPDRPVARRRSLWRPASASMKLALSMAEDPTRLGSAELFMDALNNENGEDDEEDEEYDDLYSNNKTLQSHNSSGIGRHISGSHNFPESLTPLPQATDENNNKIVNIQKPKETVGDNKTTIKLSNSLVTSGSRRTSSFIPVFCRIVPCPDKFTAFEVFSFISNLLQNDLYSTRKPFQRSGTVPPKKILE